MLHLITGGSASGKSVWGEQEALKTGAKYRFYLATMRPWGEEGKERVRRHQKQRAGKGFCTIEAYDHLENVSLEEEPGREEKPGREEGTRKEDRVLLLECMSNLVANEQFGEGGTDEEILGRVERGIRHLQACAGHVIVITNEVFSDGTVYEEQTMRYLGLMGKANRMLAEMADRVTEVVYGIGVAVKEEHKIP